MFFVYSFFRDKHNLQIINRLKAAGLQFKQSENDATENKLNGAKIVISGTFSKHGREELKKLIEQYGGKNTGSVSKSTDYFLAGENVGPSKLQKVEEFGIKKINEGEFLNMIGINL